VTAALGALACFLGVMFAVLGLDAHWRQPPRPFPFRDSSLEVKAELQEIDYCGKIADNVDYSAYNLYRIRNVTTTAACCSKCQQEASCRAWTWGKVRGVEGLSDVCYLKGLSPGEVAQAMPNRNTTSGLPFRMDEPGEASLFCFVPVLDEHDASQLLAFQHMRGAGVFGCEEYAIYSTQPLQPAPGVKSIIVHGGINSSAYTEVWKKVVAEGRFRFHEWTVKADASAVFFPARLRSILNGMQEPTGGLYFSNCEGGLRTPLAVLSRIAVQVYALGYSRCEEGRNSTVADGPEAEGHFIDQCLSQVLEVERKTDLGLLSDPSCQSHDLTCTGDYAAFYPFSMVDDYANCLTAAHWVPLSIGTDSGVSNATSSDVEGSDPTSDSAGAAEN